MSTIRVYVNGRGLDVPAGTRAAEAVRLADHDLGAAVSRGDRRITDSRGLDVDPDAPGYGGAIYRVVAQRGPRSHESDE